MRRFAATLLDGPNGVAKRTCPRCRSDLGVADHQAFADEALNENQLAIFVQIAW